MHILSFEEDIDKIDATIDNEEDSRKFQRRRIYFTETDYVGLEEDKPEEMFRLMLL